jgi:hypothetical protein
MMRFVRPAGGAVETVGTRFVPTASDDDGAQERSRDETACGARVSARPLTDPSTVALPQRRSDRFSIEVGNFQPPLLGRFQAALTTIPSAVAFLYAASVMLITRRLARAL